MAKKSLSEQMQDIIAAVEKSKSRDNFFFVTTMKRYQVQMRMLNELDKQMQDEGVLVTKEYVKGRKNVYTNPAIVAYNKTCDSANKTAEALLNILHKLGIDVSEIEKSADE